VEGRGGETARWRVGGSRREAAGDRMRRRDEAPARSGLGFRRPNTKLTADNGQLVAPGARASPDFRRDPSFTSWRPRRVGGRRGRTEARHHRPGSPARIRFLGQRRAAMSGATFQKNLRRSRRSVGRIFIFFFLGGKATPWEHHRARTKSPRVSRNPREEGQGRGFWGGGGGGGGGGSTISCASTRAFPRGFTRSSKSGKQPRTGARIRWALVPSSPRRPAGSIPSARTKLLARPRAIFLFSRAADFVAGGPPPAPARRGMAGGRRRAGAPPGASGENSARRQAVVRPT